MPTNTNPIHYPATDAPNHEHGESGSRHDKDQLARLNQEFRCAHLLSKDQLAAQLGTSKRGIEELMRKRKIPVIRLGWRTVRFSWPKVEAALAKLETREV